VDRELVLIVDDHDGFRALARRMLESSGFAVAEASSGEAAITAARTLDPDVILLDVQLPDIDGFDVARALAEDGTEALTVLVSTRERADYGPRIGDTPFLAKTELSSTALRTLISRGQ
jgi:CheY-like chemotaxis protein